MYLEAAEFLDIENVTISQFCPSSAQGQSVSMVTQSYIRTTFRSGHFILILDVTMFKIVQQTNTLEEIILVLCPCIGKCQWLREADHF